jgi:hypothetical protein
MRRNRPALAPDAAASDCAFNAAGVPVFRGTKPRKPRRRKPIESPSACCLASALNGRTHAQGGRSARGRCGSNSGIRGLASQRTTSGDVNTTTNVTAEDHPR